MRVGLPHSRGMPRWWTVLLTPATFLWYYLFENVMEVHGGICNHH
jgi:hypothetical protein